MPDIIDTIRINQHGNNERLDRRVKLTESDRQDIRNAYFGEHYREQPTMTYLAQKYGVDRRLIQFVLFPEREKRQKELASKRQKEGRYYDKEKRRKYMQNHRDYKRSLVKQGKLPENPTIIAE